MVIAISSISVNRGLCPHGLPFAACPICSGKGGAGGAGGAVKEMSWDECYSIGQRMKAEAQRTQDAKKYNVESLAVALQSNRTYQAIAQKIAMFAEFMQKNLISPVSNFVGRVVGFVTRPIVALANAIWNSPVMNAMKMVAANIQRGFANIADKLAAVIGEPMMAIAQTASEFWKKIKPKKFIFFSAVDTGMEQGEQEEEVELKRWLHLGSFKNHIEELFAKKKPDYNTAKKAKGWFGW